MTTERRNPAGVSGEASSFDQVSRLDRTEVTPKTPDNQFASRLPPTCLSLDERIERDAQAERRAFDFSRLNPARGLQLAEDLAGAARRCGEHGLDSIAAMYAGRSDAYRRGARA